MATADQIKSLVKAYVDRNDEKFKTVVLQIAAHEAKLGHDNFARELKLQIDKLGNKRASIVQLTSQNPMLLLSTPNYDLSELIVSDDISEKIQRILNEYRNRNKLYSYGLVNRRKILIEGQPGTGKTLTASIIASELSLPLYTVQMDKLVTKFMGETSAKLRQIFDNKAFNLILQTLKPIAPNYSNIVRKVSFIRWIFCRNNHKPICFCILSVLIFKPCAVIIHLPCFMLCNFLASFGHLTFALKQ